MSILLINLSKYDDLPLLFDIANNFNAPKEALSNIEKSHWLTDDLKTIYERSLLIELKFALAKNTNSSPEFLKSLIYDKSKKMDKNLVIRVVILPTFFKIKDKY